MTYFIANADIFAVKRLALLKRTNDGDCKTLDLVGCHVHICSENNFPTAAGLASSAAGYACLGKIMFFSNLALCWKHWVKLSVDQCL